MTLPPSIVEAAAEEIDPTAFEYVDGHNEGECMDCDERREAALEKAEYALRVALPLLLAEMMEPSNDTTGEGLVALVKSIAAAHRTTPIKDGPHREKVEAARFGAKCRTSVEVEAAYRAMLRAHFAERYGIKEE